MSEYKRQIERHLHPSLGRKLVKNVRKANVERMLKTLPPVMANRVLAIASSVFTQAEHWEMRLQHSNPARGIEKANEDARDRTLNADCPLSNKINNR